MCKVYSDLDKKWKEGTKEIRRQEESPLYIVSIVLYIFCVLIPYCNTPYIVTCDVHISCLSRIVTPHAIVASVIYLHNQWW